MNTTDTTPMLPWVVVTGAGTDEEAIVGEARSMALAIQFKAELHDSTADVMRRLPTGELTTPIVLSIDSRRPSDVKRCGATAGLRW